jgi:hypothetical protein
MKRYILIALLFGTISCQNKSAQNSTAQVDSIANQDFDKNPIGEAAGCKWIKENVEQFFNNENGSNNKMQALTTTEYYEFKMDAINTGLSMDSSLTEFELNQKWKSKFDVATAGVGSGFLISGQDWKKIEVSSCELLDENAEQINLKVLISDCEFQTDYHRDIKLVLQNNQIKIADIKEYD